MKKITKKAIEAFLEGTDFNLDNTNVEFNDNYTYLRLHGNIIARKLSIEPYRIEITTAGWNTATTKERLNGIPGVYVCTKARQLYLNGEPWDGAWSSI